MNEDYFFWGLGSDGSRKAGVLGRKAAVHTRGTFRSGLAMARHLDALGEPPAASNDYIAAVTKVVGSDWPTFGNDSAGDCVQCDTAHSLMLRTANAGQIVVPISAQVLALYTAETGFNPAIPSTDQGTNEAAACQYNETTGFLGHKSAATGMIDPANINHVTQAIQLFGACRTGLNFPKFAFAQFEAGRPWDVDPSGDGTIDGGHDVPLFNYKGDLFLCVTWGRLQPVTRAFLNAYCDEAHGEVFPDFIKANGLSPSGLSLDALIADLRSVA